MQSTDTLPPADAAEPHQDFHLPKAASDLASEYIKSLCKSGDNASVMLMQTGLTEAQANMALANIFVSVAATLACETARRCLQREPDQGKWRSVTDDAFARAFNKKG